MKSSMRLTKLLAFLVLGLSPVAAFAQADDPAAGTPPAASDMPENGGAGIRAGNIAPTGRTMPNIGNSRGAGTTDLDRGIQQEDNRISNSICKGC